MIAIVCFGNMLHGDDAFGYFVYEKLSSLYGGALKKIGVELFFGGSRPLDAVNIFEKAKNILVVDAAIPEGLPGKVEHLVVDAAEITTEFVSTHRFSIADAIAAMHAEGLKLPSFELFTAQAKSNSVFTMQMSSEMQLAVSQITQLTFCRAQHLARHKLLRESDVSCPI